MHLHDGRRVLQAPKAVTFPGRVLARSTAEPGFGHRVFHVGSDGCANQWVIVGCGSSENHTPFAH